MSDWYYEKNGKQEGPIQGSELAGLLKSGAVTPTTLVWTDGLAEWKWISDVADLLPPPIEFSKRQATQLPGGAMFLYIPLSRLIIMSLVSFGLYEVYWMYRNWKFLQERDGLDINPLGRGIFGQLFVYQLLKAMR